MVEIDSTTRRACERATLEPENVYSKQGQESTL